MAHLGHALEERLDVRLHNILLPRLDAAKVRTEACLPSDIERHEGGEESEIEWSAVVSVNLGEPLQDRVSNRLFSCVQG